MSSSTLYCVFCEEPAGEHGNDPWPVFEDGRCCNRCNLIYVVPARLERIGHEFKIAEEEDDAFEEEYARRYAQEKEAEVDDRRYAQQEEEEDDDLLREATEAYHQHALEEAMAQQQQQPSDQYECAICQDGVGGFDHRKCQGLIPYDCEECHDYYKDHRECQGMTRSEIVYENYRANYLYEK